MPHAELEVLVDGLVVLVAVLVFHVVRAHLPARDEPVFFGVHSEVAEHYSIDPDVHDPHTTTIDYVVAATAG